MKKAFKGLLVNLAWWIIETFSEDAQPVENPKDIHTWFELSYAQYLTLPRSLLQSMPDWWQDHFVNLLETFEDEFDGWRPVSGRYWVHLKDDKGRYVFDPFMQYRHVKPWTSKAVKALRTEKREA